MDVAKEAGVSIAAVSRILNNSYEGFSAREETKQRVFEAVRKLNYKANRAAVRLATGRHQAIALCYPEYGTRGEPLDTSSIDVIFGHLSQMLQIRGVTRGAAEANLDLVLMMRGAGRTIDDILQQASESVDGVVYVNPEDDPKLVKKLEGANVPIAIVGPAALPTGRFCSVRVDEFTAGRMAMGHLIVAGARRIVVAVPESQKREIAISRRLEGIKKVVETYSDPSLGYDIVDLPLDMNLAKATFMNHVGRWGRPDGVLTLGGILPFAVMRALQEERLRVPEDVKVVGFDENPLYQLNDPPLTGLRYPIEEMCRRAVELLILQIRTGDIPPPTLMSPKMIARRSSEAPFTPLY
jgi:DNA-binding LacI/PurR family transcriptional regulator